MKYKLIKDNDKIRLLNSKEYIYYDRFPNPDGSFTKKQVIKTSRGVISTKILTDGKIKSITNLDSNEFVVPKNMSNEEADVSEVSDLELINHSYVIRVLLQTEWREFNNSAGFFRVIKDVEIYLKDEKDKEALNNVKKTLNLIYDKKCNYSSIFDMLFSKKTRTQDITYEKIDPNIYQLVK